MKSKQKNKKPKKKSSSFLSFIFLTIKMFSFILLMLLCIIGGTGAGALYAFISTAPPIHDSLLNIRVQTSFVYDANGNVIAELKGSENIDRVIVSYAIIPDNLKHAFIAIEDERFEEHMGIDLKRIGSAILSLGDHGGSTITQQLVKNLTDNWEETIKRKVQEWYRAIELEQRYPKWKILELYMNYIYMGNGSHGVQAAAKTYFNKDVQDLSLAECASIAGIPNSPGYYDPFTVKGRERNIKRQRIVLGKMKELGYINESEYKKALNEKLTFIEKNSNTMTVKSNQSYFVDQVINDVKEALMERNHTEMSAYNMIYNSGLKIYTTMDPNVQKQMDEVFQNDEYFPKTSEYGEHPQASMVVLDSKTSEVKALYGGYGEKKADMVFNRATQIKRPPGSSIKPIAVYGPAIDQRIITAATVYDDIPVYLDHQKPTKKYPLNYDRAYRGLTTVREAIVRSINTIAAQCFVDVGPSISTKYINNAGIDQDLQYVSAALGAINGSPMLMAGAYIPFVNRGIYTEPVTFKYVEDSEGNVILSSDPKTKIVYDEQTTYIMTDMMQDVCKRGTAYPYGLLQDGNMPSAGKTGTSDDNKDKWFVGYTNHYVGATWYGYDNNAEIPSGVERSQALNLWHEVMERIHEGLEPIDFVQPSGIIEKKICIKSGKTPTTLCKHDPENGASAVRNEMFIKGTEPDDDDKCSVHIKVKVCQSSKDGFGRYYLAGPYCPNSLVLDKVFIRRSMPYIPKFDGDPYPSDWKFEFPAGQYCEIHERD